MAIDERLRLSIHIQLTELIGSEEATALIEHIMPVPWRDVATKDDLRVLSAELRSEMHQSIVVQTRWLVGYISAFGAIMLAVARLLF